MALGYNTARIRRESSYLGYAIEQDPPRDYEWQPPANAFDIFGDITSISAADSDAPACAERVNLRCIEVTIGSGLTNYLRSTEKLWLAREDQAWRLLDYEAYDTIMLLH